MSITSYGAEGIDPTFNRQVFTSPTGTWVKPTGAQTIRVQLLSAGGGGGSGRRGTGGAGVTRPGGGGGAAGVYVEQWYSANELPSTASVVVGTGGAGGASVGTDSTDGVTGGTGGITTFGSVLATPAMPAGGGPAGGASPASSSLRAGSAYMSPAQYGTGAVFSGFGGGTTYGAGGASDNQGSIALNLDAIHNDGMPNQPVGGGGGGVAVVNSSPTCLTGGDGLRNLAMQDANHQTSPNPQTATGAAVTPVATVKTLTDVAYGCIPYYGGAGGVGGGTPTAVTGGTGGAGGDAQGYGAGGGGGGCSFNGYPSGTGGRGAPGLVIVTCWG